MRDPAEVVASFNDAINARDLRALGMLMHEDHRFVDSVGGSVEGKARCLQAWRDFFEAFADYRNIFDDVRSDGSGTVLATGRSECSLPALSRPALWLAVVQDGQVLRWQVDEIIGTPVDH